MSPSKFLPPIICIMILTCPAPAGIRSAGKYCGVVVFDRWDSCILYSGVYVMYISEGTKEKLREYSGKAVEIDAKRVSQPFNPGDGLITELTYLRPAPAGQNWDSVSGLTLRVTSDFKDGDRPSFVISLANSGKEDVKIDGNRLAPTLLAKAAKPLPLLQVADGQSYALLTRQSINAGEREPGTDARRSKTMPFFWQIDRAMSGNVVLRPGAERHVRITFDLPAGQYDFLAGYGGGVHAHKGLNSNLVAFDVDDKGGKLVMINRK
jgi:hypothetical protein